MKVLFFALTSLLAQNALASPHPHRHLHIHQNAARNMKREDDSPITTWVTEWVSMVKTVEVTATVWVTPSVPESSPVIDVKQDEPEKVSAFPTPSPARSFEPHPLTNVENVPVPNLEPAPVNIPSPVPTSTEEKSELPQQQQQQLDFVLEKAPTPAISEAVTAPSDKNVTAPVDHAATAGSCTAGSPCDGDITYYDPGVGAGACGWKNTKDEPVVALPHSFMGEKSNGNPYCGKTITIVHNGKTSTARVVDKCMGCTGFSIDLSDSAFTQFEALSVGRTSAKWWIN